MSTTKLAKVLVSALAAAAIGATSASAATLGPSGHWGPSPPPPLEPLFLTDVGYSGSAGEANHVTFVTAHGVAAVVVRDSNVPIVTHSDPIPNPTAGGVPDAATICSAPTGKGTGLCVTTLGENCHSLGCQDSGDVTNSGIFHRINLTLNDGNDSFTSPRGMLPAFVSAGSGNDTIDVRNNLRDDVFCGSGLDTVLAGPEDAVYSDCESVTRGLGIAS